FVFEPFGEEMDDFAGALDAGDIIVGFVRRAVIFCEDLDLAYAENAGVGGDKADAAGGHRVFEDNEDLGILVVMEGEAWDIFPTICRLVLQAEIPYAGRTGIVAVRAAGIDDAAAQFQLATQIDLEPFRCGAAIRMPGAGVGLVIV